MPSDARPSTDTDTAVTTGMPRWVKVSSFMALALILIVVVLVLAGGGPGGHGPGRHTGGQDDTPPSSVTDSEGGGHAPPVGRHAP